MQVDLYPFFRRCFSRSEAAIALLIYCSGVRVCYSWIMFVTNQDGASGGRLAPSLYATWLEAMFS